MDNQVRKRKRLDIPPTETVIVIDDDDDDDDDFDRIRKVPCPLCGKEFPYTTVDQHVNGHFDDVHDAPVEDQSGVELTQQCTVAHCRQHIRARDWNSHLAKHSEELALALSKEGTPQKNTSIPVSVATTDAGKQTSSRSHIQFEPDVGSRTQGLMSLLQRGCNEQLKYHSKVPTSIFMTGQMDHYTQTHDRRWGCGYRNIQILSSYLLRFDEYKRHLFGGCGLVPNVAGIQMGIEAAWKAGFDVTSSIQLGHRLLHTEKWIGTTECCSLMRFYGIRSHIISFTSKTGGSHQHLIDWVWKYFAPTNTEIRAGGSVVINDKPPVYFQHQGHSRTIVGIEKRLEKGAMKYFLLLLDPIQPGRKYTYCLQNRKWAGLVKRGVHTLRMNEYELLYCDGIMTPAERERSKVMHAKEVYGKQRSG